MVAPGNVVALEAALLETIGCPEARRKQAALALSHRGKLDRDGSVREMLGIYERLAADADGIDARAPEPMHVRMHP